MKKVTSADMARRFSELCDIALNEPIVVTKNGRDRLVLLGLDEFNYLKDLAADRGRECAWREGLEARGETAADPSAKATPQFS